MYVLDEGFCCNNDKEGTGDDDLYLYAKYKNRSTNEHVAHFSSGYVFFEEQQNIVSDEEKYG